MVGGREGKLHPGTEVLPGQGFGQPISIYFYLINTGQQRTLVILSSTRGIV